MTDYFLSIAGLLIGVIGLGYAWYENRERAKVEKFIRAAGWDLYNKASNQNGHVQIVLDTLSSDEGDIKKALIILSKADGFGQYLTRDAIKLIHHVEPKFDEDTIIRWVKSERVSMAHKELFLSLTPSSNSKYKHKTREISKADDEITDKIREIPQLQTGKNA